MMLGKLLFRMARSPLMGKLVGLTFQYAGWLIPVKKEFCSRKVLAFRHPQPSYDHHLILSPKKAVRHLQELASENCCRYFADILEAVQRIRTADPAFHDSLMVIANGGKRQDVQQVHFHLFTNCTWWQEEAAEASPELIIAQDSTLWIMRHPRPRWDCHFVLMPDPSRNGLTHEERNEYLQSVLQSIDRLDREFGIVAKGYSLILSCNAKEGLEYPVFHITAGKKRTL